MNVMLVSQCDKRALTETRRILDQFAERRGDRTWQTSITQEGLNTLRKLLRKTARKNTAVACHWIRGLDHSEILWVVGNASRFNPDGATPTNTTRHDVLRRNDENDWLTGEDILLLSTLSALLHDLGKASKSFQNRLTTKTVLERNQYRHEWVSLRLFQAFVGDARLDEEWLQRLANPTPQDDARWLSPESLQRDGLDSPVDSPLAGMPPLAQAIGWLVVTHHRLPVMPNRLDGSSAYKPLGTRLPNFNTGLLNNLLSKIRHDWNEIPSTTEREVIEPYWSFPHGLPITTSRWRKQAARVATRLLNLLRISRNTDWLGNPYVMHLSRLSLMLADHHYSSLTEKNERTQGESNYPIYANTDRKTGQLCQPLDEHLLGVAKHAASTAHLLPGFARHLPRLAHHKGLRKRSQLERFRWQDKAADLGVSIRNRTATQGGFLINMASTGCGKTLANARIMNALATPEQGMRCVFALGLRTLTLQTGENFRRVLQLSDEELAIRVGGAASRELFSHYESLAELTGSESNQALLPEDNHVLFDGNTQHPLLQAAMKDPQVHALLAAPILVCTVDHLTPATESQRGGRQIAPMLRLMSSDLVLDELDDFDLGDLPALARLVYWSGLLGCRVLLSSATLPPALVQGMYEAYRAGREVLQRNRGESPGRTPSICCAWFDEFTQQTIDCADLSNFATAHHTFTSQRSGFLANDLVRRRSRLIELNLAAYDKATLRLEFARHIQEQAITLHTAHHSIDPKTGKNVSFGLVRMANINPLFEVALALFKIGAPSDTRIHLCTYHSQFPLLTRSAIEYHLDKALDRRDPDAVFALPNIRRRLDESPEANQLFIVLGSPVTEVGRDHDYDWAIVEPSSMRSLIQLAGRVRRHRANLCSTANVAIFDCNLRHFEHPGKAAYCRPGFESEDSTFRLTEHRLQKLLTQEEYAIIDARPRIMTRPQSDWKPQQSLVDLEHARLNKTMLAPNADSEPFSERDIRLGKQRLPAPPNATSAWTLPFAHLSAVIPQHQPFRRDDMPHVDVVLLPNEEEDDYVLHYVAHATSRHGTDRLVAIEGNLNHRIANSQVTGTRIIPWMDLDYMTELELLAESKGLSLYECAKRFSEVRLPESVNGWCFHPALGFAKER